MGIIARRRAPTKMLPPTEVLRRLLDYDPETGVLTWKRQPGSDRPTLGFNRKCGGKIAGSVHKANGYRIVGIRNNGKLCFYPAQRVIWKFVTGDEPGAMVDHEDLDRLNNRWTNLRNATHGQNKANSAPNTPSGFKGVYWSARHRKWRAVVRSTAKINHIGYFDDPIVAATARHAAAVRLQGEFARTF